MIAIRTQDNKIARRRPPRFELMGGPVCLDFINTLDDRSSDTPQELLKTYLDLARFGEDTCVLTATQVDRLFTHSEMSPEAAQKTLTAAIEMREAMFAVFSAIARKKSVPAAALATLNQYIQGAAQHFELVPATSAAGQPEGSGARFEWHLDALPGTFESALWPIARSAGELLASDQLAYVRMCASKTCEWFFLDSSKNHRRRWCDMTKCGNRAKFRAYYGRKKKAF